MKKLVFTLSLMLLVLVVVTNAVHASDPKSDALKVLSDVNDTYSCAPVTEIPTSECQALVALYNATDGPNWDNNQGWLATTEPCSWYGVTCSAGHVSSIDLGYLNPVNTLNGTIPDEIANLTELESLALTNNDLSGTIPSSLGSLANLRTLRLNGNNLSGSIPTSFSNLTSITDLILNNNHLDGNIPSELGQLKTLRNLFLNNNDLSGSLPASFGGLEQLNRLYLGDNNLSGDIPVELTEIPNLQFIYIGGNQFTGVIPEQIGQMPSLVGFGVQDNQLEGTIPVSLGDLQLLRFVYLDSNQLSGIIPASLCSLPSIILLSLDYNKLMAEDACIDTLAPGWQNSQTVAPTDLSVIQSDSSSITVGWSPIPYTQDGGYYEISVSEGQSESYVVHGFTADKNIDEYVIDGLAVDSAYKIRIRTYTPSHSSQQNELWSDYSPAISASTKLDSAVVCATMDFNNDKIVDILDINTVLFQSIFFDAPYDPLYDLDDSGLVDIADIFAVAVEFGRTCP